MIFIFIKINYQYKTIFVCSVTNKADDIFAY